MGGFAQIVGNFFMLMAVLIFVYFTTWLFGSQFFSQNSAIQSFFPPLQIALYGPLFLLAGFVAFVAIFLIRANSKMQKKK